MDGKLDGLYMNAIQMEKGIEPMFDSLFSFLRRKSDFFTGANDEQIETIVLKALRKQNDIAKQDKVKHEKEKKMKMEKKMKEEKHKREKMQEEQKTKVPRFEEIVDNEAENEPMNVKDKDDKDMEEDKDMKEDKDTSEDKDDPPPVGNGGKTEKYEWTQTLQETHVVVEVPQGTKARDVKVDLQKKTLKIGLKSESDLRVDGEMFNKIKVDDSFWTIEDGNRICVYLQKENQMEWWKTVIKGDPEIDTQKVQPENSKLSDLDGDTRQTVEKMMVCLMY